MTCQWLYDSSKTWILPDNLSGIQTCLSDKWWTPRTVWSLCPCLEFHQFIHLITNPHYWNFFHKIIGFSYHVNHWSKFWPLENQSFIHVSIDVISLFKERSHVPYVQGTIYSPLLWLFLAGIVFSSHPKLPKVTQEGKNNTQSLQSCLLFWTCLTQNR